MTDWIQDWFGSEYYALLYKHRGNEEAKIFLDNLIRFLKPDANSRILDCGCGRGRHSIYFAEKGFEVTGIDLSEPAIVCAKKHEKANLTFFTHDVRNLFRINYYDIALSLFTSFGYFEKDSENNKMIKSISASLKKDGIFILDFMNIKRELKTLISEQSFDCNNAHFKVKRNSKNGFIIKEIHIEENRTKKTFQEKVKGYNRSELDKLFNDNNLKVVHSLGDYQMNPFDEENSERLILIGKKI